MSFERLVQFLMIVAVAAAPAVVQAQTIISEAPAAALANSREFVVRSKAADREFLIQVAAPVRPLKAGEKAAVIYVLDGDYMFGMAADVARNLQIVREIDAAYVVGIGYPGDSHQDWVLGRLRDMLDEERTVRGYKAGGGGRAFRTFLLDELKPLIESRFPVETSRSYLYGHSLGGLFGAVMLSERPTAFAGYAIGSPSIWIRPEILDALRTPRTPSATPRRIYVGVGGEEREEDMVGWAARLAQTTLASGHDVKHRIFSGEGHVSVEGVIYANALKFLLPAPPAPSSPSR